MGDTKLPIMTDFNKFNYIGSKYKLLPTIVEFIEENGKFFLVKTDTPVVTGKFKKFRGIATAKMSTNEIMSLTRE